MIPVCLATNNASTTLLSSLNATDTTMVVAAGTGSEFPNPTGGNYFYLTLSNIAGDQEIVKVTLRNTDTMTIVRGQDNTVARVWLPGDFVQLRIVAAAFNDAFGWAYLVGQPDGLAPLDANANLPTAFLYTGGSDGVVVLVGGKVPIAQLPAGVANGLATLNAQGVVPSTQLPTLAYLPLSGGTLTGDLLIQTSLEVNGDSVVDGATTLNGTLQVGDPATFLSGIIVNASGESAAAQINGNANIQTELVVGNTIDAGNTITAPSFVGVMQPSDAANQGFISGVRYSTSAPSGAPVASEGAWWIQYEN
jgi:hypothetical protein